MWYARSVLKKTKRSGVEKKQFLEGCVNGDEGVSRQSAVGKETKKQGIE